MSLLSAIVGQLDTVTDLKGKVLVGQPERLEHLDDAPYAWISNVYEPANGNQRATGPVCQRVQLRVEVTTAARGWADMLSVRDDTRAKLIGFLPAATCRPMEYQSGRMEFSDPGWCLWRDEYLTDYYLEATS